MENPLNEEEKKKIIIIVMIGNISAGKSDFNLSAKQQREYQIQSMIIGNNNKINNKPREVDKSDVYQLAKTYNDLYYEIDNEYDSNILFYVKDL